MRRSSTPSGRVKMKVSGRFDRPPLRVVAGQRADMHGLADAVDAALGPGKDVECAGRGAALDAAVGQIEAGLGHVEEDEVAFPVAVRLAIRTPAPCRLRRASGPALKTARPSASVVAVPRTSLLRASSVTSTPAIGLA
jgi:hypothetical protein